MPQSRPFKDATSAGNRASNSPTACRRALRTAVWSLGGRIGMICATDSSDDNISAISRRKASPFRFDTVARYAEIATRIRTSSGEGGGRSNGSFLAGIAPVSPPQDEPIMIGHGESQAGPSRSPEKRVQRDIFSSGGNFTTNGQSTASDPAQCGEGL